MQGKGIKVLVFVLARRGCIAYANEMISQLTDFEIKIYASSHCEEALPSESHFIPTFKKRSAFLLSTFTTLPNFLWKIRNDVRQGYQIFYFPVFHHWNPAILWLGKRLGVKTVLTIHDAVFHPGEWQLGQRLFQHWAIPQADGLVTLSIFVKNQLPKRWQVKTQVIPHPRLFAETIAPLRVATPIPKLLFLGRIAHYKGVDLLLEAVKNFPSSKIQKLTIAGMPMQETPLPITTFPIQKIERWLSDEEILQLLQEHDILVLPYREASQSGVVTLGISSAIPMIITNVGGLPEQLAESEAMWVAPSVESIQKGLLKLIEEPDLYQNIHQKLLHKNIQPNQNDIRVRLKNLFQNLINC